MGDAASLMARLRTARSTARMVDPVTGDVRDVAIDPAFAWTVRPDTLWLPIVSNIGSRLADRLTLRDEDRVVIDQEIDAMVGECAIAPISDEVLAHVLQHIADRGFTLVPEPKR